MTVVGQHADGRDRPAAPTRPGGVIDIEGGANCFAAFPAEERPARDEIGCRVTDAEAAEVDDGAQAAVLHDDVSREQVSMDPDGRSLPGWRGDRGVPGRCQSIGVQYALPFAYRFPDLLITHRERHSSKEVSLAGAWPIGRIDRTECDDEPGEINGCGAHILDLSAPVASLPANQGETHHV
jgi:hypothetical protein